MRRADLDVWLTRNYIYLVASPRFVAALCRQFARNKRASSGQYTISGVNSCATGVYLLPFDYHKGELYGPWVVTDKAC